MEQPNTIVILDDQKDIVEAYLYFITNSGRYFKIRKINIDNYSFKTFNNDDDAKKFGNTLAL